MYKSIYINDYDENLYKRYLNNANELKNLMQDYLDKYGDNSDSYMLAFKESLDHYVLKQIINSNGNYIKSVEFHNYINYIMQVSKSTATTLAGTPINMELTSNIVFRNPQIRAMIFKKYYNESVISFLENNIVSTKNKITSIYRKMKNREKVSQEELDLVCDYIYSSRDFSNDIGKTCAEYIFNEIRPESNIKASVQILGALTSYFTQCFKKDKDVKNSRTFIAVKDKKMQDIAHKFGNKRYCYFNKNYFTRISLLDDRSLNKGRTYGKDLYYLMMVAFHELTHEHQYIEKVKNKNTSSAMAKIVVDVLNRNLVGNIVLDKKGNQKLETEYMINHDSTEFEIQADEESWRECARFIASHCRQYAYSHNLDSKIAREREKKCLKNEQEIRARRAFSLKKTTDGNLLYYALYDIQYLVKIVKCNPRILADYPVLNIYFDKKGDIDTSILFSTNITSKDSIGLELDNTGLEFATYMLDYNKDKILEKISGGNLTKNQIRTLITNIYNIMHQNVLKIRDFDKVDKSNYDRTAHNFDLDSNSDAVYNYYFKKTAVEIYNAMEILYKIHEYYPKIAINDFNDTKYYISYFYELVSKVKNINLITIERLCNKYDSSNVPILLELSKYMKENILGSPNFGQPLDGYPSGSMRR